MLVAGEFRFECPFALCPVMVRKKTIVLEPLSVGKHTPEGKPPGPGDRAARRAAEKAAKKAAKKGGNGGGRK